MTDADIAQMTRENAYLKLRCSLLQNDVTDLNSQVTRLRQELERFHDARPGRAAELHKAS